MFRGLMRATVLGVFIVQLAVASAVGQETKNAISLSPDLVKQLYFDAAQEGRVDLLEASIKDGMNIDLRDSLGFTPLILATYNGQLAAVNFLIDHDSDPTLKDLAGNTAGSLARQQDNARMTALIEGKQASGGLSRED
jgi:ankyrin repeat protein